MAQNEAETDTDLIWAAIAGLRRDVSVLEGRLERIVARGGQEAGAAEEAAEAWREARQKEIDRLLSERAKVGKGEEIDEADREQLEQDWLSY